MSAPPVLAHRDAIVAALEAAGVAVGPGVKPPAEEIPPNGAYAVLYMDPGVSVRESLADARIDFSGLFQLTCVAPTEERCLWLADKVRTALHAGVSVAGRDAWRPEEQGGPPLQRDDDVTPPLFFLPIQYQLQSIPA